MPTPEEEKVEQDRLAAELAEKEKAEKEEEATDFDKWLAKQPESAQKLYEQKTGGLKSALEKERTTNKANKDALKKLADLEAAEKTRREAELSEIDKANAKLTEADQRAEKAEKALTDERVENAVYAEANKAQYGEKKSKFANPEIVYKLINLSEIEIKDGKPIGIPELLKALAKDYPNLLEQAANGDRVGSPSRDKQKQQTEIKRADYQIPRI